MIGEHTACLICLLSLGATTIFGTMLSLQAGFSQLSVIILTTIINVVIMFVCLGITEKINEPRRKRTRKS